MSTWHELVVEGPERELRAFLEDLERRRGSRLEVVWGDELVVSSESLVERIRDVFHAGRHTVLFAPGPSAAEIASALGKATPDLTVVNDRAVTGASLAFSVEVYSRELANRISGDLEHALPPGVTLTNFKDTETVEEDAKGTELYAPAHDYIYTASGVLEGPLPGILEMRRRASNLDFVTLEPVTIRG